MKPSRGKATVLMTGGAAEAAESKPDTYVAVCLFTDTNLFDQVSFQVRDYSLLQYTFSIIPRRTPVDVVTSSNTQNIGSPVELPKIEEPTVEQINEYHRKFIEHVVDFFEKEKYKYVENADSVHLEFV
ncbi:hypothetical protein K0M31_007614 [Melipona bicolor]|uniref:Uncharacterized protein n=1 Tax=Melipona bicolor TaxID=60889 RepID=A0AA40GC20_9HYME|nr:hypothetical protein K0M31_007614 [Melipona bicolor]